MIKAYVNGIGSDGFRFETEYRFERAGKLIRVFQNNREELRFFCPVGKMKFEAEKYVRDNFRFNDTAEIRFEYGEDE